MEGGDGGSKVNLADAAEAVLKQSGGKPLTSREIADRAVAQGLAAPRSSTPWTYVAAAIRKDNRRRKERGEQLRFSSEGDGRFGLLKSK